MESDYIAWLTAEVARRSPPAQRASVRLGIGDDAAIINTTPQTVCCADLLAEGTHFVLNDPADLVRVGRKSLAVNLSDMAAMGARPETALLSLLVNRDSGFAQTQAVTSGLLDLADQFHVSLVGGDTCSWNGGLVVNVTVNGTLLQPQPLLRSGARAGDSILVTGSLGGSILRHHWAFTPRCHAIHLILQAYHVNAATDISDGLARDLRNVTDASSVGAILFADQIPISAAALSGTLPTSKSDSDRNGPAGLAISQGLWHAIYDGEDFELLLTMPPDAAQQLVQQVKNDTLDLGCSLTIIGKITSEPGLRITTPTGEQSLPTCGYQH
jgi:thiamine-monophosphate kinase